MTLEQTIRQIQAVEPADLQAAQRRWDSIAKPLGSLGLLEQAVIRMAGMKHGRAVEVTKPCVVVMCADNGVVAEGVTQASQEVTAIVTANFTTGATSVCHMAAVAGAEVIPVDIGVACDVAAPGLWVRKIAYGTNNMTRQPAMSREQAVAAIEVGIAVTQELAAKGCDLFATGEMGIGNTTSSSALTAVLLGKPISEVTGRGAGLSGAGLSAKMKAIHRAIALNQPDAEDVLDTLSKVGGLDIAGLAGVFLGGAALRLPVVVDGFISAVAALCAVRLCPAAGDYLLASHVSKEPAGKMLLEALHLRPFLTAEMCLGEGTGAVAVIPILKMACRVYREMSTFSEIQVEEYQPLL